jgi:hypothetical protein
VPIELRVRACRSLSDLQEDEPEFDAAIAILGSLIVDSLLAEVCAKVLALIGARREENAQRLVRAQMTAVLPAGVVNSGQRLIGIFKDSDADWEHRNAACWLLGDLDPPGARTALLEAFLENDVDLAYASANALFMIRAKHARLTPEEMFPSLAAALSRAEPEMKAPILYAIGRVCGPRGVETLINVVDATDEDPGVRLAAVESLPHAGSSDRARARLCEAILDVDPAIRIAAIGAVSLRSAGVREALERIVGDPAEVAGFGRVGDVADKKLHGLY